MYLEPTEAVARKCSVGVLRNSAKFTGKHLCQGLFFNKVAVLRPFFIEHFRWLLLNPVEHLRRIFFAKIVSSFYPQKKISRDVWQGSKYAS